MRFFSLFALFFITLGCAVFGVGDVKIYALLTLGWAFTGLHQCALLYAAGQGISSSHPSRLAAALLQNTGTEKAREQAVATLQNINGFLVLWFIFALFWVIILLTHDSGFNPDADDDLLHTEMQHVLRQSLADVNLHPDSGFYRLLSILSFPALCAAVFTAFVTAPLYRLQNGVFLSISLMVFCASAAMILQSPELQALNSSRAFAGFMLLAVPFGMAAFGFYRRRMRLWQMLAATVTVTGFIGVALAGTGPQAAHQAMYITGWVILALLWHTAQPPGRKRYRLYR